MAKVSSHTPSKYLTTYHKTNLLAMPTANNNMTVQAYGYLHDRTEAEVETALTYFNTRILYAKRKRVAMPWLVEALPMMEHGSRTAKEILDNLKLNKSKPKT